MNHESNDGDRHRRSNTTMCRGDDVPKPHCEKTPLVGILMGSLSDSEAMKPACETLALFDVPFEARVISAHRTPDELREYARNAQGRGIQVIIAGAGMAAHLAGAVAANTTLPVIGVPIDSGPLSGLDALLSTAMMPPGIPVATMAIGGAKNAALLAVEIMALGSVDLQDRLSTFRDDLSRKAHEADVKLNVEWASRDCSSHHVPDHEEDDAK